MRFLFALLLAACAAEETALPPLVPVPDEPPPAPRDPLEPPPVAERDVNRCDRVVALKQSAFEKMEQKRYSEAKHDYLRAIELDPADKDAPAQLARIDKLTENGNGSDTAIAHAQSMGAARAPCDGPPAPVAKVAEPATPPPTVITRVPAPPAEPAAPPTPPEPEVRQDGTVIITAKDEKASKQLPTATDVQKVLSREDGRIVGCYTAALARDPSLNGKATYLMTIDKDGKVAEAKASDSSMYDGTLDQCIAAALKRVAIKKPGGQVEVYYALRFSSSRQAKQPDQRVLKRQ